MDETGAKSRLPKPDRSVIIVQHPAGDPLKLAIGPFVHEDPPGVRVAYRANTLKGSSGSPVLDANLHLVALHNGGDAIYADMAVERANHGVPYAAIQARIERSEEAAAALGVQA
jgi:hypothetical protein